MAHPMGTIEYIIVGLGNPGSKYEYNRHNCGFLFLDVLANKYNVKIDKLKFKALVGDAMINSHRCLLMKPQTFMNNSGEAVRQAADFYKIPPEKIIVIFDDILLDVGRLRIRRKGTDGGHNGIKSMIYHLNSDNFPRIKVGVGAKPHPEYELADWVLSDFKKDEVSVIKTAMENAVQALELLVDDQIDHAMSKFNS